MIRVLLVDDEPLARDALRARLASSSDVEIVGEADVELLGKYGRQTGGWRVSCAKDVSVWSEVQAQR